MQKEVWKKVAGFEDYEVSNLGRVQVQNRKIQCRDGRVKTWPGRMLKLFPGGFKGRYRRVSLWKRNKGTTKYVHILVAEAFIGPRPSGKEINHKDGDPTNNRVGNLEYVTGSQNKRHYHLLNRGLIQGEANWNAKIKAVDVKAIRVLVEAGFPCKYVADLFGLQQMQVSRIARRKRWKHVK
jgi:hypothetical protein